LILDNDKAHLNESFERNDFFAEKTRSYSDDESEGKPSSSTFNKG